MDRLNRSSQGRDNNSSELHAIDVSFHYKAIEIEIPQKSAISAVYLLLQSPDKHDSFDIVIN